MYETLFITLILMGSLSYLIMMRIRVSLAFQLILVKNENFSYWRFLEQVFYLISIKSVRLVNIQSKIIISVLVRIK
jgi:hypothetical protein